MRIENINNAENDRISTDNINYTGKILSENFLGEKILEKNISWKICKIKKNLK